MRWSRRLPVIAVVATLGGLLVYGTRTEQPVVAEPFPLRPFALPTADAETASSSTWYCAAGTAADGGIADLTVVMANPGAHDREGTLTWLPSEGRREETPFEVQAGGVVSFPARDAVQAPWVSAMVEVDGGGVVVEHTVRGPRGLSDAPCSSAAADRWFLANGSTSRDATQHLFLFNPFPDDAIVDITVATGLTVEEPAGLQGLPVPAGRTTVVAMTEVVRREDATATTVVVRNGRLVVDRLQAFDGTVARSGLSLTLAAPALSENWVFPDGQRVSGQRERWHISNPGSREAIVALEVVPREGMAPAPAERTVPPRSQVTIDADELDLPESATVHASAVRSLNGVGVVVERELDGRKPLRGWSSTLGAPLGARRWALAAGAATDRVGQHVIIQNTGPESVTVSVSALTGDTVERIDAYTDIALGPAAVVDLDLGEELEADAVSLVVEADGPVVVERLRVDAASRWFTRAMGVPLPE